MIIDYDDYEDLAYGDKYRAHDFHLRFGPLVTYKGQVYLGFLSDDGTKWFVYPNGFVADHPDREYYDMSFDNLKEFIESNL